MSLLSLTDVSETYAGREVFRNITLLLDEPTDHLDSASRERRERRLRAATRGARRPRTPSSTPARSPKAGSAPARPAKPTFDQIADQIASAEADLAEAAGWLGNPDLSRDPERARAMRLRYEATERRLSGLYDLLEQVEDEAPGAISTSAPTTSAE